MDASFYTAVRGAMTQQTHMDILANNIANVNTNGYKSKTVSFQDLIYNNMNAQQQTNTSIQAGAGSIISHTSTNFQSGTFIHTGNSLDFAIEGNGFFRIYDPNDNSVSYTKDGAFLLSETANGIYLTDDKGRFVVDAQRNPITLENGELSALPGIFEFVTTNGMLNIGENSFIPIEQNGADMVSVNSTLKQGYVEGSNVDLAQELSSVIESSKAYSYMLKMVQTADEIEQTINSLR